MFDSKIARLPNVVVIIADDLGFGDISCYNKESKINTPNIDQLAERGMIFTDAHAASSVCTPSRYGLLTGRYCWRTRLKKRVLYGYEPPLIEAERLTIASMFKQKGYTTACIGKWHLGLGFSAKQNNTIDFNHPLPWKDADRNFEEKIDFSQPIKGGPIDLGFDYFFGTTSSSTSQPPYAFIENNHFLEIPKVA
jgi:arylsulfatase A-like enzyme